MLKRDELEVQSLDKGPEHPVLGKSVPVGGLKLLLGVGSLHDGHGREEHEQVGGSKDGLIKTNTGENLGVGRAGNANTALQEAEPGGSERTEDS